MELMGFEPTTSSMPLKRSPKLSYSPAKTRTRPKRTGGADGIRTHCLFSAIEALSQLSYGPTVNASIFHRVRIVKSSWGSVPRQLARKRVSKDNSARLDEEHRRLKKGWGRALWLLAAAYLLLALAVHVGWLHTLDYAATENIQRLLPGWLIGPFSFLSVLGSAESTILILLAVAAFLMQPQGRIRLILLFIATTAIEYVCKGLINQPPPPEELSRYAFAISMPTSRVPTAFAFPSGHAARTTFLTLVVCASIVSGHLSPWPKRLLLALLVCLQATMLVSRVAMGEHWMADVAGGLLLGAAAALAAVPFVKTRALSAREPGGARVSPLAASNPKAF